MKNKEIFIGIGVTVAGLLGIYLYKRNKDKKQTVAPATKPTISVDSSSEKESLLNSMADFADRQTNNATKIKSRAMYTDFKGKMGKMSLQECTDYMRIVLALEKNFSYLTQKVKENDIYKALSNKYELKFSPLGVVSLPDLYSPDYHKPNF